jgi:hypothetical protein
MAREYSNGTELIMTQNSKKLGKPKRWRVCDECEGSGKKPIYWDSEDEIT